VCVCVCRVVDEARFHKVLNVDCALDQNMTSKASRFKAKQTQAANADREGSLSMSLIYNEASSSSPTSPTPLLSTAGSKRSAAAASSAASSQPISSARNGTPPLSSGGSGRGAPTENKDTDESYGYDFVIIVPNPEHKDYQAANFVPEFTLEDIVERLHIGKLQTYVFKAADNEEFVIKIRIPLARLKEFAEEIEFDMKVDEYYLDEKVDCRGKKIANNPGMDCSRFCVL
jgi:hypothetical protein